MTELRVIAFVISFGVLCGALQYRVLRKNMEERKRAKEND